MSPDRQHLFAVNTPDNRLEIFRITSDRPVHTGSIPVGLEPVAVAARTDHEVWVVNHLSDGVSVIALDDDGNSGHVVRTLLVGDEPRDLVFAGPKATRAFITTAHRGQKPAIPEAALRDLALSHPVTYTCVPPGSGLRLGVDRDGDDFWDGDERAANSDPADPTNTPVGTAAAAVR
jgi:DNA-binding beta-propeller fold protein YncE